VIAGEIVPIANEIESNVVNDGMIVVFAERERIPKRN
jgi:hypothetical protein